MTGSNDRAIELLEKVTELEPEHAEARWRLATLLYDQAIVEEAEHHFTEAVRLNPADAHSHHMLGVVLLRSGRYQEAPASLQQAIALTPNDPGISVTAFALRQLGRDDEAIDWYQKVLELAPDSTRAYQQQGQLLLKQGRVAEAADRFEHALQLDPDAPGLADDLRKARQQRRQTIPGSR